MTGSVVVIGGGVAGLCAARRLALNGAEVTIVEGSPRLGGKLHGIELEGLPLDVGAESVLASRPEAVALIRDLGLGGRLVHPGAATAHALINGRPVRIPASLAGIPTDLASLHDYLTAAGWERAAAEPSLPAPPLTADVAIGQYVAERFGDEVADRLLEPLLGGVYAGHSRALSFAAVSPSLYARAKEGGSLLDHAAASIASAARDQPGGPTVSPFAGLRGGIAQLVGGLAADLSDRRVTIRTGTTVRQLERHRTGYRLICGPAPAPEVMTADAVILATPTPSTARLLAEVLPPAAERLATIGYASMAVVLLMVEGVDPIGSGLLVPPGELPTVKALTHSDRKWPWLADMIIETGQAGRHLVRASVGRAGEEPLLQVQDPALVRRTFAEIRTLPGWEDATPVASYVQRWGGGLPQYAVGHTELVSSVEADLTVVRNLAVCGAAYHGIGIPACIVTAETAAANITAFLQGSPYSAGEGAGP